MTPFQTESWEQLEPTVKTLWRINGAITSVVLGAMVGIPEYFIGRNLGARYPFPEGVPGLIFFLLILVLGQLLIGKSYDNFRFKLGEDDLAVAKGVFWKNWKFISRNRVQHVDITAGPINQALGIVQVSIYVGGMATAAAVIPGLTEKRGEDLRRRLIKDEPLKAETPAQQPAPPQAPAPPVADGRPLWSPDGQQTPQTPAGEEDPRG